MSTSARLFVLFCAVLLIGGCASDDDEQQPTTPAAAPAAVAPPTEVTPRQIAPRARRGDVLLVDVREDEEWRAGHAPWAVHVPLGEVPARLAELDRRRGERPIAFICASGNRSAQAASAAADGGLADVINVSGGMGAWHDAGLPLVPRGGRVL